ncbi:vacuolar protein sorting-associated protein 62 [Trichoderma chlorosporum]
MSELYSTTTTSFSARWNDKGSGASRDGGFWHPTAQGSMRPLGSVGVANYNDINGNYAAQLVGPGAPSNTTTASPVASPTGYTLIWNDQKSGANKDGSFWRPIPPNGYVALGDVAASGWSTPDTNDIWCVRQDLATQGSFGSNSVWDDKKSGAKSNVSVWEIRRVNSSDVGSEVETAANYIGPVRASQDYDAPDSNFAQVPLA